MLSRQMKLYPWRENRTITFAFQETGRPFSVNDLPSQNEDDWRPGSQSAINVLAIYHLIRPHLIAQAAHTTLVEEPSSNSNWLRNLFEDVKFHFLIKISVYSLANIISNVISNVYLNDC